MANEDWDEAVRRIEDVRESGATRLSLTSLKIDSLPPEVASLTGLHSLDLGDTPIAGTGLIHIAGMTDLQKLYLDNTQITDTCLTYITGMTNLRQLLLSNTQVKDLRPLLTLPMLIKRHSSQFDSATWLKGTPALNDPAIAAVMQYEYPEDRRKALLAHLRSLPPWPEPLPNQTISVAPAFREAKPTFFKPISMSAARSVLEESYPLVRDRCQAVSGMLLDAQANLASQIPNEPEKLEAHNQVQQSLTYALGLMHSIHDALPEDFSDRPLTDEEVGVFRKALNSALVKLEQASRYVDRAEHGVTYGGILRLGVASALGGVVAFVPGVNVVAAVPAVYACLYGKEGAKSVIGAIKSDKN